MKQTYIFNKDSNREYLFFIAIIPLILYGIYKNAFLLVNNNYLSAFNGYKIILYPIILPLAGYIISLIFKKKKLELIMYGLLLALSSPFSINMFLYITVVILSMIIYVFIPNKYRINEPAFIIFIFIIINHFTKTPFLYNPMELGNDYKFTLFDLFYGRGASFLFTSSIFWALISYLLLIQIRTYKKDIFLVTIGMFSAFFLLYMLINHNYVSLLKLYLNGTTFFTFIFLAPINESSPTIKTETIIYSFLIALLSFIFVIIFKYQSGAIIAVLLASIVYRIYNIIRQKMFLKQ